VEFVRVVYGAETLEENLDFVSKALGNRGATSREVIRIYFLRDYNEDLQHQMHPEPKTDHREVSLRFLCDR
jgi:hypothetical protein